MKKEMSRRNFLGLGAAAAAGAVMLGCNSEQARPKLALPPLLDAAPDGPALTAGLIGCGGRGTGAAFDFLSAGPGLKITALGDVFEDRLNECHEKISQEKSNPVDAARRFVGFDAYQKVINTDVDIIILATPPHFRPDHFEAAVAAKKHIFMEKPVAVDPVGVRKVIATARRAKQLGLNVATGTQRRHQRDYIETYKRVAYGDIGEIVSANCYWNQSQLWYRMPQKSWSDMEYMIRDWVNWCWLSGDHICEQHIHNIDVINWFSGKFPMKAVGFGGRQRRKTGDQFDFFSVDYMYEGDVHLGSMCRQINGCAENVSEFIRGTKGYTNCRNTIHKLDGSVAWSYDYGKDENGNALTNVKISPYTQEHIDLVTNIRNGESVVEAEATAMSTMSAIMGRISAYTGTEVTMEQMMASDLRLGPAEYDYGPVAMKAIVPVPGVV